MNNYDPYTGKPLNNNNSYQNNSNTGGYNPNSNPGGYNPNGYNPNGNPGGYNPNGYNPNGNPGGYNPNGYNPNNNPGGYNPNGYNPNGAPNGFGGGRLPIESRNIVMYVLLSIVTCGIFALYWMACLNDDVNTALGENDTSGGMVVLLSIVTCGIYGLFWVYTMGGKIGRIHRMMGNPYGDSNPGVLYLVLSLFTTMIVPLAIAQNELNKYASQA